MKTDNHIEQEIAKTLGSLDDVSAVKVKPYFYTRLSAKMQVKDSQSARLWNWSLAAMTVVILVNVISLLSLWPSVEDTGDAIDLMATEYSLTQTDIYNTTLE